MFPISDDNPTFDRPYATYFLFGLNIAAWLLLQGAGFGTQLDSSVCSYGLIPSELFGGAQIGVCDTRNNLGALSVISSMFMHGSWMHIAGNMLFLWVFGDNVEDVMGPIKFIVFYLLGGITAAAFQVFSDPSSSIPMVGASGAIGAVMGGYLLLYPKARIKMFIFIFIFFTTFRVPAFVMLGYWIAVQMISAVSVQSATGGVAFWAHIGGFAFGAITVHLFKDKQMTASHPEYGWNKNTNPADIWKDPQNRK